MLTALLRLLPERGAEPILAFLGRMGIAHSEPRAVSVRAHHVLFTRDVDRGLEAIRLRNQEFVRIEDSSCRFAYRPFNPAAVAPSLDAINRLLTRIAQ
jgi:hypothetical protein